MQVHSYKYSGLVRATAPLPLLSLSVAGGAPLGLLAHLPGVEWEAAENDG